MEITAINTNSVSTKGKFVFSKNLTYEEIDFINKINNTVLKKKTNTKILRFKPYDVLVSRNKQNPKLYELTTSYKSLWSDKPNDCFISFIHADGTNIINDINSFRSSLDWFNWFKKGQQGYNNGFEKFSAYLRELFNI